MLSINNIIIQISVTSLHRLSGLVVFGISFSKTKYSKKLSIFTQILFSRTFCLITLYNSKTPTESTRWRVTWDKKMEKCYAEEFHLFATIQKYNKWCQMWVCTKRFSYICCTAYVFLLKEKDRTLSEKI